MPRGDRLGFAMVVEPWCLSHQSCLVSGARVDIHLYRMSSATAADFAQTSGVVDLAPDACWSLNALPRPEKKILPVSYIPNAQKF
jgi:hypothetical protein